MFSTVRLFPGGELSGVDVSHPDSSEREADRVADRVMRTPSPAGPLAYAVAPHIAFADGAYAPSTHQGRHLFAHELTHVVQQAHQVHALPLTKIVNEPARRAALQSELLRGLPPGEPLDPGIRDRAQDLTRKPLTGVRVHRDERTRRSVDLVDSEALTIGNNVLLGTAAETERGPKEWLLAHEIAHAYQQQRPRASEGSASPRADDSALEMQADAFADALVGHRDHLDGALSLSRADRSIAQKVIWKYMQDLPGNLLLIIDVDDGDFVGGCVKQIVPHAGVKLIMKFPNTQLFNAHVGFLTNVKGEYCVFFYESVTGVCELLCFPTKEELERAMERIREWLADLLKKVLIALVIAALIAAAAILAYMIAQAIVAALLVLLAV